jgi:hypothetical protein
LKAPGFQSLENLKCDFHFLVSVQFPKFAFEFSTCGRYVLEESYENSDFFKRMEELKEKEDVSLVGLYKLNPSLDPKRLVSTLEPIT